MMEVDGCNQGDSEKEIEKMSSWGSAATEGTWLCFVGTVGILAALRVLMGSRIKQYKNLGIQAEILRFAQNDIKIIFS